MRGITRIKRIIRNTRRLVRPVAAILVYHRVIDLPVDTYHLAVSPSHFAEHLEIIRQKYAVVRLSELPGAMKNGSMPRRPVVITFDDGYGDNFSQALPLLERYQAPATIFVVSGMVGSACEFWWDDLERILLSTEDLPAQLTLAIGREILHLPTSGADQRRSAFTTLHEKLRGLPFGERQRGLVDLSRWAGLSQEGRSQQLPVRRDMLCQAAQSAYIEIGAHTKTHPVLSALDAEEQRAEILESRLALETELGHPLRTFAYPYGNPEDFTPQTVEIVRAAGFAAAVTTLQGAVEHGDDPYQLKRCEVNDWDADTFRRKLDSFFYT